MIKNKRFLWVAGAIIFLVAIFWIKNISTEKDLSVAQQEGLVYTGDDTLEELVLKDTDEDGVPDWQEKLLGDGVLIDQTENGSVATAEPEILTETDKFSRELLSTVTSLTQNDAINEASVDALTTAITDKWESFEQKKVFKISDLKKISADDAASLKAYSTLVTNIPKKYPVKKGVLEVLQEIMDNEEENTSVIAQLPSIATQMDKAVGELLKMSVPQSLIAYHLEMVNNLEKISEITSGLKYFYSDPVIAVSALGQLTQTYDDLESATNKIFSFIREKTNS